MRVVRAKIKVVIGGDRIVVVRTSFSDRGRPALADLHAAVADVVLKAGSKPLGPAGHAWFLAELDGDRVVSMLRSDDDLAAAIARGLDGNLAATDTRMRMRLLR